MTARRLILIEGRIAVARGHYFAQLQAQREAARLAGWECRVYAGLGSDPAIAAALDARCVFDDPPEWVQARPADPDIAADAHSWRRAGAERLWDAVRRDGVRRGDIVMMSTGRTGLVASLDRFFGALPTDDWPAVLVRIHNGQASETIGPPEASRALLRQTALDIAHEPWTQRIFLLATNVPLARTLERLCWRRVFVPPMPILAGTADLAAGAANGEAPRVCIRVNWSEGHFSPEDARALMRAVWRHRPGTQFVLSAPSWTAAQRAAAGAGDPRVREVGEVATLEEHLAVLASCEIVYFAVPPSTYRDNYSAVLAEAVALGRVVVVPAGTLLAATIKAGDAAGTVIEGPAGSEAGARALAAAISQIAGLRPLAARAAERLRAVASGAPYVEALAALADAPADMRPRYEWGETVDFGSYLDARRYLGAGWSTQEPQSCWAFAPAATVTLPPARPAAGDGLLEVDGFVMVPGGADRQTVGVAINGVPIDRWTYQGRAGRIVEGVRTLRIPAAAMRGSDLAISFLVDTPARPSDLGISPDPRPLGLAVRSLTVRPADA